MTTTSNKPATSFWIISALALVWNAMGAMAYITQVTMSAEGLQALPADQQALITAVPVWVTAAFAFAVWGGLLGCLLLLIRKRIATPVLIVSFVAIVVQMIYNMFMSNSIAVYGPGGMIMPIMVLGIGAYLIWYSRDVTRRGWIS